MRMSGRTQSAAKMGGLRKVSREDAMSTREAGDGASESYCGTESLAARMESHSTKLKRYTEQNCENSRSLDDPCVNHRSDFGSLSLIFLHLDHRSEFTGRCLVSPFHDHSSDSGGRPLMYVRPRRVCQQKFCSPAEEMAQLRIILYKPIDVMANSGPRRRLLDLEHLNAIVQQEASLGGDVCIA